MKILAISDQIDPLIYTPTAKERFSDADLVLFAGDLRSSYIDFVVSILNKNAFFVFGNHDQKEFLYYHTAKTYKTGPHPTTIHDFEKNDYDLSHSNGATYCGFKTIKEKALPLKNPKNGKSTPLLIAGASGTLKYNKGIAQYTERQMFFHLLKMVPSLVMNKLKYGRYCDIFLTHASPRHVHDKEDQCHKGFNCFNWFIKKFKPKYLVHGHIHLYDLNTERVTKVFDTTVINCFSYYYFDFDTGKQISFC